MRTSPVAWAAARRCISSATAPHALSCSPSIPMPTAADNAPLVNRLSAYALTTWMRFRWNCPRATIPIASSSTVAAMLITPTRPTRSGLDQSLPGSGRGARSGLAHAARLCLRADSLCAWASALARTDPFRSNRVAQECLVSSAPEARWTRPLPEGEQRRNDRDLNSILLGNRSRAPSPV